MRYLGWLVGLVGVVCVLVYGAGLVFLKEMPTAVNIIGGAGAVGIGLFFVLDWGSLSQAGHDQTVGRSVYAGFATLLVAAITITLNVLGHRYDDYVDVTETKKYSLAQQSIDVVSKLDQEVQVLAFFMTGSPEASNFKALMETYGKHTSLLKVEYHDPYAEPRLVEEMKILTTSGTVILKVGENQQRIESKFDEESFTNALVRAASKTQHKICVIAGHGEGEKDDLMSTGGLGFAMTRLEGMNYTAVPYNLAQEVPTRQSCDVLLLHGPKQDLLPVELDRMAAFVAGGGGLIAMLDPLRTPATAQDMARYGIAVGDDVVVENDPNRQVAQGDFTFILLDSASYDFHPLTEKLRGMSLLRLARSVGKGPEIAGINVQELARSSESSWAETKLDDPAAAPDPTVDRVGKVPLVTVAEVTDPAAVRTRTELAAAPVPGLALTAPPAEAATPEPEKKAGGKVVVFGDSDFAANEMIASGVNLDLILNTVAWMVGEEDQISIRPNEASKGKLALDAISFFVAAILSLLVVPALTVAGAVGTWLMRRRM